MLNNSIKTNIQSISFLIHFYSPLQLLDRHGDLEVMSQHMESGEDVCPLDHLSQGTPLEDLGAENISGLFCQEAHVDENLQEGREEGCILWLQWSECGPPGGCNKEQRLERSSFLLIFQHCLFFFELPLVMWEPAETEDWRDRLVWTYHTILMYWPTTMSIFNFQSFFFFFDITYLWNIQLMLQPKTNHLELILIAMNYFNTNAKHQTHAHCMKLSSFKVKLVRWKLF